MDNPQPTTDPIEAIRERANNATPGPWKWRGNVDIQHVVLRSLGDHRDDVMRFLRWGMQEARPMFLNKDRPGMMNTGPLGNLVVYDVCHEATSRDDKRVYRGDFIGIRHPDAEFIAHSREDITTLLAEIDRLRGEMETCKKSLSTAWQDGFDAAMEGWE